MGFWLLCMYFLNVFYIIVYYFLLEIISISCLLLLVLFVLRKGNKYFELKRIICKID